LSQKGRLLRGILVVKCSECGLLALKRFGGFELVEANSEFREDGSNFPIGAINERFPVCFVRRFDLESECSENEQKSFPKRDYPYSVKEVIQRERPCELFTPWRIGFSPKEHREFLDYQMEKEWREQRLQEDREWRNEQAKLERRSRTIQIVILALTFVASIIIPIIAAFIPVWF
jgi:hypothetical protein